MKPGTFSPFKTLPKFLSGAASVLDLGATMNRSQQSELVSDSTATASDWEAVGNDLRESLMLFGREYGHK